MAANLELVPATAGKRLGAAVLDWLAPVAVLVVTFAIGFAGITRTLSGGFIIYDTASVVLFGSIGLGLTIVYLVVLLGMEGRSGGTIGNRVMGIRSADKDGYAPGTGAVFLRGLITGAGIILALVAAVLIVIFKWFDIALFILGPLVLLGTVWAVLVVVSNTWDANGKLRGWHDAAAKTLVFDVSAGRNPITSGGIQGPYSFAPLDLPPVQQVASPVARQAAPVQPYAAPLPRHPHSRQPHSRPPHSPHPRRRTHAPQPPAAQPAPSQPYAAPQPYAPASFSPPAAPASHIPGNSCGHSSRTRRRHRTSGRRPGPHADARRCAVCASGRGAADKARRRPGLPARSKRPGGTEPRGPGGRAAGAAPGGQRSRAARFPKRTCTC